MKKGLKYAFWIFALITVISLAAVFAMSAQAKNALSSMVYGDVDMRTAQDGIYDGETDAGLVSVKVRVTIRDHAIQKIDLMEHKNGMGAKAESILSDICAENSFHVDAISGATLSSEAIKSAVSKALEKSCQK